MATRARNQFGALGFPCWGCTSLDMVPALGNSRLRFLAGGTTMIWSGDETKANVGQLVEPLLGCDLVCYHFEVVDEEEETWTITARRRSVATGFTYADILWSIDSLLTATQLTAIETYVELAAAAHEDAPGGAYVDNLTLEPIPEFVLAHPSHDGRFTLSSFWHVTYEWHDESDDSLIGTIEGELKVLTVVELETGNVLASGPVRLHDWRQVETAALVPWVSAPTSEISETEVTILSGRERLVWEESDGGFWIREADVGADADDDTAEFLDLDLGGSGHVPRIVGYTGIDLTGTEDDRLPGWYYVNAAGELAFVEEIDAGSAARSQTGAVVSASTLGSDSGIWDGILSYRCGKIYCLRTAQITIYDIASEETSILAKDDEIDPLLGYEWYEWYYITYPEPYWYVGFSSAWRNVYQQVVADKRGGGDSETSCLNACGGPETTPPCECAVLVPPQLVAFEGAAYECGLRAHFDNEENIILGTCDGEPIPTKRISYIAWYKRCGTGATIPTEDCDDEKTEECPDVICLDEGGTAGDCPNHNLFNQTRQCTISETTPSCLPGTIDNENKLCKNPDEVESGKWWCEKFVTVIVEDLCGQIVCMTQKVHHDFQAPEECCCWPAQQTTLRVEDYEVIETISDGDVGVLDVTLGSRIGPCVPLPPENNCCAGHCDEAVEFEARLVAGPEPQFPMPAGFHPPSPGNTSWEVIGGCDVESGAPFQQFVGNVGVHKWEVRAVSGDCKGRIITVEV